MLVARWIAPLLTHPEGGGSLATMDDLEIKPLGSGCEVGRSCVLMTFKGYKILFDCGVHPAHTGLASLPYFDDIDPSEIDLLLVTHFHMDHCGAVPYFTEKTGFRGRVFMTHATKAIYKILMHDASRLDRGDDKLFDEKDMLKSMEKIELLDYHQHLQHKGIKFWCYNAGHVLGACMFMVEVAGVRVLYTGDFSREEDRHLCGAETPAETPHVLICEATYGVALHMKRELREQLFCAKIHEIVARGGRCLIPVFALGRSQELLLILDDHWKKHPELHGVPIYYASTVAKKCMRIYETYINTMNHHIIDAHARGANPWQFSHVRNLSNVREFDDSQPMVVMASPGMMQSGLSRELFEGWCSDRRNGLMMPGYSVAGTLAHHVLNEPKDITTSAGDRVPVNLSINYVSFSAHSDYAQTSEFIAKLRPYHVILVHGGEDEMARLKSELSSKYDPNVTAFYNPRNCQTVQLRFKGDRHARVVGSLAAAQPIGGLPLDGLLIKKDFSYTLMAASHLHDATSLAVTTVMQRPRFRYLAPLPPLLRALRGLFPLDVLPSPPAADAALPPSDDAAASGAAASAPPGAAPASTSAAAPPPEDGAGSSSAVAAAAAAASAAASSAAASAASSSAEVQAPAAAGDRDVQAWRIAHVLTMSHDPRLQLIQLEWTADPVADMVADAVTATLLSLSAAPPPLPPPPPALVEGGGGGEAEGTLTVKLEDGPAAPPSVAESAAAALAAVGPTPGDQTIEEAEAASSAELAEGDAAPPEDDSSHAFFASSKKELKFGHISAEDDEAADRTPGGASMSSHVDYFQALGAVDGGLAVRRLLNAHFGKVDVAATPSLTSVAEGRAEGEAEGSAEEGAAVGAEGEQPMDTDAAAADAGLACSGESGEGGTGETRLAVAEAPPDERVELTAAGERIVVRPRLPLAPGAVECADPEVASRVTGLLTRVQRASLPLS